MSDRLLTDSVSKKRYQRLSSSQIQRDFAHFLFAYSQLVLNYIFVYYFASFNNSYGNNPYFIISIICFFRAFCSHSNLFLTEFEPIGLIDNNLRTCMKPIFKFLGFLLVSPIIPVVLHLQMIEYINLFNANEPKVRELGRKMESNNINKYLYIRTFPQTWKESMPQVLLQTIFMGHEIGKAQITKHNVNDTMITLYLASLMLFIIDLIGKAQFWCYCVDITSFIWNTICASLDIIIAFISIFFSVYFVVLNINGHETNNNDDDSFFRNGATTVVAYIFCFKILITFIFVAFLICYMVFTRNFFDLLDVYFQGIFDFLPQTNNNTLKKTLAWIVFAALMLLSVESILFFFCF